MDVSIIIVNYNTCGLTNACIDSVIEKTKDIDFEIILIDNASTDESKEFFSKRKDINYLYLEENVGFGKGNNAAIPFVHGRNVLYLNSDTLLVNNAIKILSDYMDSNPTVSACGGNLYNATMNPTLSFEKKRLSVVRELCKIFRYIPLKIIYGKNCFFNYTDNPIEVGYVSGADLMTRKVCLDKVGGFSPEFFMYYEESELQERLSRIGKIMSVPQAKIQHLEGATAKTIGVAFNDRKCRWMYESEQIYLNMHYSKFERFLIWNLSRIQVYEKMFVSVLLKNRSIVDNCKQELAILKEVQQHK